MFNQFSCRAGHLGLVALSITLIGAGWSIAREDSTGAARGPVIKGPTHTVQEGLSLDAATYRYDKWRRNSLGTSFFVEGVKLSDGTSIDLELERFEVLTDDALVVVGTVHGEKVVERPDVALFRGHVVGDEDSRVYLGMNPHGVQGAIDVGDDMHFVSTGSYGQPNGLRIAALQDVIQPQRRMPAGCGVDALDPAWNPLGISIDGSDSDGGDRGEIEPPPCRIVEVAIDTDWAFTDELFAGNTDASTAYAITLMGAISEIYRRDLNVRLTLPFVRVWESDVDPYDAKSSGDMLGQFRTHWNENETEIERHLAHLLSGAALGGGVAYLNVVCSDIWGYAVSGNLGGSFPYPLDDFNGGNWDVMVTAHETGHNMGSGHTHDSYTPPIDECAFGICEGIEGTIMSYCHLCPGGLANVRLGFHELVIERILEYLDSLEECGLESEGAVAIDDHVFVAADATSTIDALVNDFLTSCGWDDIIVSEYDALTEAKSTVTYIGPVEGEDYGRFSFTPLPGVLGNDSFTYTLSNGEVATVHVNITAMRGSVDLIDETPGVGVTYYEVVGQSELPDFSTLTGYATDVAPNIDYPSTLEEFATSGRAEEVGAVYEGYVLIDEDDIYTLSIDSDDGSKLYLGVDEMIDNDGLHGMIEKSVTVGLQAGYHAVRVEFFENLGGAGLIVRQAGSDGLRQPIDAEHWFQGTPVDCEEDLEGGDLVVDSQDLLALLFDWGPCARCQSDFNNDGVVDAQDLLQLLLNWGPC